GDEIAQREAIVRSDEVDAAARTTATESVQVTAAAQAVGKLRDLARVTLPEFSQVVAIFAIPFAPQNGEIAHLITEVSDIPRLRDELHARKNRVLVHDVEKGGTLVICLRFARQRNREIEPKAVDVHLLNPVP